MSTIKEQVTKVTKNPIGLVIGAVGAFYVAKKYGKVENKWALVAIAVGGAITGSFVNAKIKASKSVPTESSVKK